ncbi:multiheme c-type cytochrome [Sulfurimonas sp.]|uniref:multiheme c-type cytochrome n=1 Tax=Sulfurimonas sp. TaxID=2022749 RepID=UPI002624EB56|nr:multiheme c-type cytochrome [Sulfurimonas sp.]
MKFLLFLLFTLSGLNALDEFTSSQVCQKCHPVIYNEYYQSQHRKASIFSDPVHKAVWDKHPFKKKGIYECAKCHTPNDKVILTKLKNHEKALPVKNRGQLEGVSCVSCHNIKSIQKHSQSNVNIITTNKHILYSARESEKSNNDKKYKMQKSLFGFVNKESGSPYHDIDFTNEIFYNGNVCMGCHSHKENSHKLQVCTSKISEHPNTEKENCITCHMPKVPGSFTTLRDTHTHRFHGFSGPNHKASMLRKYLSIEFQKATDGFNIILKNSANHPLLLHPLRVGMLKVSIESGSKKSNLKPVKFIRIIGKNGHPTPPWVATEVLKDTQIQAKERRIIHFKRTLEAHDKVIVQVGEFIVNPKMAKKLNISNNNLTAFRIFKEERFDVK